VPSGEKLDISSLRCRAVRSLQSGLSRINREILACFAYFEGKGGSISLQSRLRGGAERIRPLGTGLKPVRADVCASYPESGALRILCDCVLAAQSSLTDGVSEGVRRRILGDCVAESGHFEAPESAWLGWRVTACLAGVTRSKLSPIEKIS